jgi:hypothetical protein
VEGAGVDLALQPDLIKAGFDYVLNQHPHTSKIARVSQQIGKLAEGRVRIPVTAAWLPDFCDEITAFPLGKNDDQVDVLEAFLRTVDELRHRLALWGKQGVFNSFGGGVTPGVQQLSCKVTVID